MAGYDGRRAALTNLVATIDNTARTEADMVDGSVFLKIEFFLLVVFSLVLPCAIYAFLMLRNAISRRTVFALALLLIALSGIDLVLLRRLQQMALQSLSTLDDTVFVSELSLALYLLPAVFAGIGTNLLSHALIAHLTDAERMAGTGSKREAGTGTGTSTDAGQPVTRSLLIYLAGRWRRNARRRAATGARARRICPLKSDNQD